MSDEGGQTELLMQLRDSASKLLDVVDGHRADCVARGYSPTAAEVMAMDFHRGLISAVFAPKGGKS